MCKNIDGYPTKSVLRAIKSVKTSDSEEFASARVSKRLC